MGDISTRSVVLLGSAALAAALLAGCTPGTPNANLPAPKNLAAETTETSVFYSTGRSLLEERKVVDSTIVYESTLKELLRALPESNSEVAVVQPETEFNSVTFEGGVLTVDWKKEVLDFDAEDKEKRLAFASLLATFGQFDEVEKVRFTVEGKDTGKIGGKSIEAFWGEVSLKDQPWDPIRVSKPSDETSAAAEETSAAE